MTKNKPIIIDVREPDEFESGHVQGAINIPSTTISSNPSELDSIPKDAPIIVYCVSGNRSSKSIEVLKRMGYMNLTNGINRAQTEGLIV